MRPIPEKGDIRFIRKISWKVILPLGLAILFWASAFVAIRSALNSYSPESMALLRFLVASAFLGIYSIFFKIKMPLLKDIPLFFLTGFAGITIYHIFLNLGEKTVSAGTASFLISTVPIFTGIFSLILLKEKLKIWGWIGILISFSGIALISFSEGNTDSINIGTLFILIAAVGGSIYIILQKKLLDRYRAIDVATITIWFGTIFMLIYIPRLITELKSADVQNTLEVVYLGIFPAAIAYVLWSQALTKFKTATHITSFLYISPIVTMVIGVLYLNELPNSISIIGGLIALGGVILTNTKGRE
jgi:drug/metabolite transporter (DMT)-like permease